MEINYHYLNTFRMFQYFDIWQHTSYQWKKIRHQNNPFSWMFLCVVVWCYPFLCNGSCGSLDVGHKSHVWQKSHSLEGIRATVSWFRIVAVTAPVTIDIIIHCRHIQPLGCIVTKLFILLVSHDHASDICKKTNHQVWIQYILTKIRA